MAFRLRGGGIRRATAVFETSSPNSQLKVAKNIELSNEYEPLLRYDDQLLYRCFSLVFGMARNMRLA